MDARTWSVVGAASGAAGAVVYAVSAFTAGSPLKPDASTQTVVAHLADKRDALLSGYLLAVVAVALLFWFVGYLRAFLADAEGGHAPLASVTLAAWVALLVTAVGGAVPLVVVTWEGARHVDAGIVRMAFDAGNLSLYALTATAAALSVLAPIVVIGRSGVLPRWLVVLGGVEIAVNVAELAGLFSRSGENAAGYVFGLGPFIWVVWVAAVSVSMVLRAVRDERVASAPG